MGMRVALARITLAAAVISATVSPFIRRAVMKAPIWASVASPIHDDLHGPDHLGLSQVLPGDHLIWLL